MLEIKCVNRGRGQDTYEVKGNIMLYTEEEIADECDFNNQGYRVLYKSSYEMKIIVYTD